MIFSAISTALAGLGGATGAAGAGAAAGATGAAATGAAAGASTSLSGIAGALGTAGSLAGTYMQYQGARDAADAQMRAEGVRQVQMETENRRQRRQIVRQATIARAESLSNTTAQGASEGSGFAGALGQIQGEAGGAMVDTNQNTQLGRQMFGINRQISRAQTMQSMGSGLSSLAGSLVKNQGAIGRLGAYGMG